MRLRTGRVRRWQHGAMVLRWFAAGYLETEKRFRRIMGYEHMWVLGVEYDAGQTAGTL